MNKKTGARGIQELRGRWCGHGMRISLKIKLAAAQTTPKPSYVMHCRAFGDNNFLTTLPTALSSTATIRRKLDSNRAGNKQIALLAIASDAGLSTLHRKPFNSPCKVLASTSATAIGNSRYLVAYGDPRSRFATIEATGPLRHACLAAMEGCVHFTNGAVVRANNVRLRRSRIGKDQGLRYRGRSNLRSRSDFGESSDCRGAGRSRASFCSFRYADLARSLLSVGRTGMEAHYEPTAGRSRRHINLLGFSLFYLAASARQFCRATVQTLRWRFWCLWVV
jgi:hypothetical protein